MLSVVACRLSVEAWRLSVEAWRLSVEDFRLAIEVCMLSVEACRLPIEACMLSVESCSLPIEACRLSSVTSAMTASFFAKYNASQRTMRLFREFVLRLGRDNGVRTVIHGASSADVERARGVGGGVQGLR